MLKRGMRSEGRRIQAIRKWGIEDIERYGLIRQCCRRWEPWAFDLPAPAWETDCGTGPAFALDPLPRSGYPAATGRIP